MSLYLLKTVAATLNRPVYEYHIKPDFICYQYLADVVYAPVFVFTMYCPIFLGVYLAAEFPMTMYPSDHTMIIVTPHSLHKLPHSKCSWGHYDVLIS